MPRVAANKSQELGEAEPRAAQRRSHERIAWRARTIPLVLLFVLSVGFRLPALVNAQGVHSDAAIVGLQAMHMLRGEWSPLLFGSGYQTSVDSAIAALFFVPAGPSPLALMLSTFAGHLLLTYLAYAMLRRYLGPWGALVAVLPLVFTPPSVHTYVLHPPRQASLTLVVASFWALDRASRATEKREPFAFAAGAALASLACFADPYAMVFLPGLGILTIACAYERGAKWFALTRRVGFAALGALAGLVPLLLLWRYPGAKHGTVGLTAAVLEHNYRLLADTCLPWGLSYQAWTEQGGHWAPWVAPLPVHIVQVVGAILFVGALAFGAVAIRMRGVAWEVRRLGLVGAITCAATIGGFLASVMVMDHFSTRYLASIVLVAPFALAPMVALLHTRKATLLLAPYLASAALCGWVGFAPWTSGLAIVATRDGTATDERALERMLTERGVGAAMADYWVSYRLTLLWAERIVVVPKNLVEDRYAPYLDTFARAKTVAYVFDPERSREARESIEAQLRDRGVTFTRYEILHVGRLVALVATRGE
jgi:hypothetical protein